MTSTLAVDGVHAEVTGTGPPVVFSHDGLLHGESWDAQFAAFAGRHRVARWDRRGYGRSPRPSEPYSSADDLAAVVRAVSDGPAAIVGCSLGSLVSARFAVDHPGLLTALVLVGPFMTGLQPTEHFITRGGRTVPGPETPPLEQIEYWSREDPWFVAPANTAARDRLRELLMANPRNLRPPMDLERVLAEPVLPRLGEIAVPTLIVVGEHDVADVHAHSGAIEAAVPGAERVVLTGSGHMPHLETPEKFNSVVLDFLARASEGSR